MKNKSIDCIMLEKVKKEILETYDKDDMEGFMSFDDFFNDVDVTQAYEPDWEAEKYRPYYRDIWQSFQDGFLIFACKEIFSRADLYEASLQEVNRYLTDRDMSLPKPYNFFTAKEIVLSDLDERGLFSKNLNPCFQWELAIDKGEDGTESIGHFKDIKEAITELLGCTDETAFIDLWSDCDSKNTMPIEGSEIKKKDLEKIIGVIK